MSVCAYVDMPKALSVEVHIHPHVVDHLHCVQKPIVLCGVCVGVVRG